MSVVERVAPVDTGQVEEAPVGPAEDLAVGEEAFGAQGGDPSRGVSIDLSTCVNRYGPPAAVIDALHRIGPDDIRMHPYDAHDRVCAVYAWATGVDPGDLEAGRGVSEFIWTLARRVPHSGVAVPVPAYTDYLKAFPGRGFSLAGEQLPGLDQVDAALAVAATVIISNPHNPTGAFLPRDGLLDVAARHRDSLLVVDESYINFTPDPLGNSVIGCDLANVVVLRSSSKFYGIAASRAGVMWAREHRHQELLGRRETWGLSGIDAIVAETAIRCWDWADESRAKLLDDSRWLAGAMAGLPGVDVWQNENVHFQYAFSERAAELADALAAYGVGVRALGHAHGVRPGALRVVAPRADERRIVADAISGLAATMAPS